MSRGIGRRLGAVLGAIGVLGAGVAPSAAPNVQVGISAAQTNAPAPQQAGTQAAANAATLAVMRKLRPDMFTGTRGRPWPWWVGAGKRRRIYANKVARTRGR